MKKRFLAALVCAMLLLTLLPTTTLAAETDITIKVTGDGALAETGGTGWTYDALTDTLTIQAGYRLVAIVDDNSPAIPYLGITGFIINYGVIEPQPAKLITICTTMINYGTIKGGDVRSDLTNYGTISGGAFRGIVSNYGTISGGAFNDVVSNYVTISGGDFRGTVTNYGTINGGNFEESVSNQYVYVESDKKHYTGAIRGGTFQGTVSNIGSNSDKPCIIDGGIFYEAVTNGGDTPEKAGKIQSGYFVKSVFNDTGGSITGGSFLFERSGITGRPPAVWDARVKFMPPHSLSIVNRCGEAELINRTEPFKTQLAKGIGYETVGYTVSFAGSAATIGLYANREPEKNAAGQYYVDTAVFHPILGGTAYEFNMPAENTIVYTVIHVPVTDITGVPTEVVRNTALTLSGTVAPADATYNTIEWSVKEAGDTGAVITDGIFRAEKPGTVTVMASIANDAAVDAPYTKDFNVVVRDYPVVTATANTGTDPVKVITEPIIEISGSPVIVAGRVSDLTAVIGKGIPGFGLANLVSVQLGPQLGTLKTITLGTDYSGENGSIILTLHKSYLDTLAPGVYTLQVNLTGKGYPPYVQTTVTVLSDADAPKADVPETGDVPLWARLVEWLRRGGNA